MPQTIADVGDIPGRPQLSDAEKQAFADERNANAAKRAAELADPAVAQADMLEALFEAAPASVKDAARNKARARGG